MLITEESLKRIKAEFIRTEKIDGDETYVLRIENMIDLMALSPEEKKMMKEVRGKGWVDANDWVIRKIEMEMKHTMGTVKTVTNCEDYRKLRGMLVPYRTTQKTSHEFTPEMIKKHLQEVPPEYRKQAEAQMKAQMGREQIRITKVKEVKVNTGLSDELFDGSNLGK